MSASNKLTTVWDILARLGPEDNLQMVKSTKNTSGLITAGNDWVPTTQAKVETFYKSTEEAARFMTMVETDRCAFPGAALHLHLSLSLSLSLTCHLPAFASSLLPSPASCPR
jgi:hypothetical protein